MQIIQKTSHLDFMGARKLAFVISALAIIVAVGSFITRGLNFGIDFTGGVLLEVGYEQTADLTAIRNTLAGAGFGDATVQNFGSSQEVLIRLLQEEGQSATEIRDQMLGVLRQESPDVVLRRVEFVGPQVGEELREQGGLAMLFALLMIMAYVTFRFQWKFSIGAVTALVHDVVITVGVFSVLRLPFDLSVLAAVLAVIGYSLNDTIVVFDRIRENFLRIRKTTAADIVNLSINQMLGRTIITSFTTLLVLFALFFLGGETIHAFSLALIIGIVVGTYSSIYIASTTALALDVQPMDLMAPEKEQEVDESP
ncbi:MAG: protein translocase subunit SecF [Gammaproteobacteria bacterium]